MPFSNSIWGACCFKSSSGHHESSSIEFRPCFQHYFIFNLSWTSFHLLSPLRCFLQQKTLQMFPDLMQWRWCSLASLLFWFATGLSHVRVAGSSHNPAGGDRQYLSWAAVLVLLFPTHRVVVHLDDELFHSVQGGMSPRRWICPVPV